MKASTARWLWAVVAVLMVCVSACSKDDEPQPTPTPNPGQEESYVEIPEQWGDEHPHGFYFDIDSISLPLNDEGFLRFKENDGYHDYIVIDKSFIYLSQEHPDKIGALLAPTSRTGFYLEGKRATPWNYVDKYIEMYRTIRLRPKSQFSNFPDLMSLLEIDMSMFGLWTDETLINVDVISHKYFNENIPAGGSMKDGILRDDPSHSVSIYLSGIGGDYVFTQMLKAGQWGHGGPSPERVFELGECDVKYTKYIMSNMWLWMEGYPERAGDYPMTLRMEFASGKVLTRDFKIRFVDEK